jgi:AraC-like DNA-binding protein
MVSAKIATLGEIVIGKMITTSQHLERSATMTRRDQLDSFLLVFMERGCMRWAGEHNCFHAEAGDLFLLNNQDIFRSEWSDHQQIYAVLPRDLLTPPGLPEPRTSLLRAADPRAELLRQHLRTLWQQQILESGSPSATADQNLALGLGLASLTSIYFNEPGYMLTAPDDNHPISLSTSIQQWLTNNLHRSELDANTIAATFHISRSTLYELFRPFGGVRTYLQTRRLEVAREILESADQRIAISQLAINLGFRSVSSFSRSFHERWGMTPKQARQPRSDQPDRTLLPSRPTSTGSTANEADLQALRQGTKSYYDAVRRLSNTKAFTPSD